VVSLPAGASAYRYEQVSGIGLSAAVPTARGGQPSKSSPRSLRPGSGWEATSPRV